MSGATQTANGAVTVRQVDYTDASDAAALVLLLDSYARDPAGGGQPLSEQVKASLPQALAARPQAFSVIAWDQSVPVGLVNCVEGFSTFACRPLVNVHDVVVLESHRGQGVGQAMLALVEQLAAGRGACKLTLEVLQGNHGATRLYERLGFAPYQLDPALGDARFFQKKLG